MRTGRDEPEVASGTEPARVLIEMVDPRGYLRSLEGKTRGRAVWMLLDLALAGYGRVKVRAGRRSLEEEERLYGQGRDGAACRMAAVPERFACPELGQVVWCRPEDSKHVRGEALDLDLSAYKAVSYSVIGAIGELCGFTWGGRWRVKDYGHFELGKDS